MMTDGLFQLAIVRDPYVKYSAHSLQKHQSLSWALKGQYHGPWTGMTGWYQYQYEYELEVNISIKYGSIEIGIEQYAPYKNYSTVDGDIHAIYDVYIKYKRIKLCVGCHVESDILFISIAWSSMSITISTCKEIILQQ